MNFLRKTDLTIWGIFIIIVGILYIYSLKPNLKNVGVGVNPPIVITDWATQTCFKPYK